MADIFSKRMRSRVMAAVKSSGNRSTEKLLASLFRKHRLKGWRSQGNLPGTPDFVFPGARLAVFVDGCFWHGCGSCRSVNDLPKKWVVKILGNKDRDKRVGRRLRYLGWRVLRFREHYLAKRPMEAVRLVRSARRLGLDKCKIKCII